SDLVAGESERAPDSALADAGDRPAAPNRGVLHAARTEGSGPVDRAAAPLRDAVSLRKQAIHVRRDLGVGAVRDVKWVGGELEPGAVWGGQRAKRVDQRLAIRAHAGNPAPPRRSPA